ncbi:hypothetical protein TNIN_295671, partial [Trichonephila inaurata madagascariensis]
ISLENIIYAISDSCAPTCGTWQQNASSKTN